jgi:hypothetical protein
MVGDRRGATAYAAAPDKKLGKFTSTKMRSIYPTLTVPQAPVADAATLRGILNATPIIDKVFTTLPTPAIPAPAGRTRSCRRRP